MPKISALPAATTPTGNELVAIVQSGVTSQTTVSDIGGSSGWVNIKSFGAVGDGVTNDTTAFLAFRTWALAEQAAAPAGSYPTIKLYIPPGDYIQSGFLLRNFTRGIKKLIISGYGVILNGGALGAETALYDDNTHDAAINTVTRGATSVTTTTPANAGIFAVNDWVYIGAIDLQGYGSPVNHHFFEFAQVASVNTSTGVVGLNEALKNTYLSTYPTFNAGDSGHPHNGGPARLYLAGPDWDSEITAYGLTFPSSGQTQCKARKAEFFECNWLNGGAAPTVTKYHHHHRCQFSVVELDKAVEYCSFTNCEFDRVDVQSSSVTDLIFDDCSFSDSVNGTAKNTVIRNSTIPSLKVGPLAYGFQDGLLLENCIIAGITYSTGDNLTIASYSVSNGVITVPISSGPIGRFVVPGATYQFETNGLPWKVLDVTQVSSNYLVHTTLPQPLTYPGSQFGSGGDSDTWTLLSNYEGVRAINCTGCLEAVNLSKAEGRPGRSYVKRGLAGNWYPDTGGTAVFGDVDSVTVNVLRAYTGSGTLTMGYTDYCVNQTDQTSGFKQLFVVNLKIAGKRVVSPLGNTGAQSGDTLFDLVTARQWMTADAGGQKFTMSADISAETLDKQPVVQIEIITNHGVASATNWAFGTTYIG